MQKKVLLLLYHACGHAVGVTYRGIILAKLGRLSTITIGTASHAYIEIENHAALFLWSTWLD